MCEVSFQLPAKTLRSRKRFGQHFLEEIEEKYWRGESLDDV
jgi:hypothetical protein